MPLKPGMRPTPIAVVREEDGARIIALGGAYANFAKEFGADKIAAIQAVK